MERLTLCSEAEGLRGPDTSSYGPKGRVHDMAEPKRPIRCLISLYGRIQIADGCVSGLADKRSDGRQHVSTLMAGSP